MIFHYFKILTLSLLGISIAFFSLNFLDQESRKLWLNEHGIVENLSVMGYGVCVVLMVYWGRLKYVKKYHYFIIMMIFFAIRELGLDKVSRFDVFHPQLYLSTEIPYKEKLLGLLIAVPTSYSVIFILKKHLHPKSIIKNLKNLAPYHFYILLAMLSVVFSQIFDLKHKLANHLGITLSESIVPKLFILEELLELAMPMFFALATYSYFFPKK